MKKFLFLLLMLPLLASCSSSDDDNDHIDLKTSDATLYYGDTIQIRANSDSKITYSSENKYYADVSDIGLIKAGRVGQTTVGLTNGKDTKTINVTIKAKSNLYPEPNLEFGISKSDLIKKLGTPDKETNNAIGYSNYSTNAPQVAYLFDDNNKLTSSSVLVNSSKSSELGTFLGERYLPIGSKDYTMFYINSLLSQKSTMGIGAKLYTINYWMVTYIPYTNEQKSISDSNFIKNELDKIFK